MNLVLKLSKLCNLRCAYCYEYEQLANPARMPLDGLSRFLDGLGEYQARVAPDMELHFALHGGEPLLLPPDYLRALVALQQRHLAARRLQFRNVVQTNLYKVPPGVTELLAELNIGIGVSLDVHGGQRVTAAGRDAEARVQKNLRDLLASGLGRRVSVGGISVLHADNVERAADTFRFFAGLGMDYRILPIFSMTEPPARMRELMLEPPRIVAALKAVLHARLRWRGKRISILPLDEYLEAAARDWSGEPVPAHDSALGEWALIIDTNGDVYNHSEAYDSAQSFGNAFAQPFGDLMASPTRQRLLAVRAQRARTCERCEFNGSCSHYPVTEALPSEREIGADGMLRCPVAQPMIAYCRELFGQATAGRHGKGKRYHLGGAGRSAQPVRRAAQRRAIATQGE